MLPKISPAQDEAFSIRKAEFSSDIYDEFCPVYYNNGIVFCTDRNQGISSYSDGQNKNFLKINYIDTTGKLKWQESAILSKDITSKLNDGPATFSRNGDTIYFSRNQSIDPKISKVLGPRNKLGIFSAVLRNGKWSDVKEFRYNIEWYNVTTPCLSPDGKRLFFSSDQPGGQGGFDLYYCDLRNGSWGEPVNAGPVVNTKGNESYPFINESGELFFSSDGHKGLGGKDIFVTKSIGSGWHQPLGLEKPVNSEADDIGIVTDRMVKKGYFSSNRSKSFDIYQFESKQFHFWFADAQKENQYCFTASDTGSRPIDTLLLKYVWSFGDGSKMNGSQVMHCYGGPGVYNINLDLFDRRTGKLFFNVLKYKIEIVDADQPYINSPYFAIKGETFVFDGLKSYTPGNTIINYFWDFGDGTFGLGERVSHIYNENGEYYVKLGLMLKSIENGEITRRVVRKQISVLNEMDLSASQTEMNKKRQIIPEINSMESITIEESQRNEARSSRDSEYQVVILTSPSRIDPGSTLFRRLSSKYSIKESYDEESGVYSYIVDQQMELMHTYPAYTEMISSGYNDTKVRLYVLTDPAEIDLHNLKIKYGVLTDNYFDQNSKLLTTGILMLNQLSVLLKKYPDLSIEIGVHSDDQGNQAGNQWLTQKRAQMIADYLNGSGVDGKRMLARGFGGSKPIAENSNTLGRKLNRRVDFYISERWRHNPGK